MNPTDNSNDPKSSPPTRSTLASKSIRSKFTSRISESPLDIGRPTSVLHSAFPMGLSSNAAPLLRAARSTALPALSASAASSTAAPPTYSSSDFFFVSTVLEEVAERDVVELITLPVAPSWVPKGYSTTSYLRTTIQDILGTTPHPIRVARAAAQVLNEIYQDSKLFTVSELPDCFHRLAPSFPTYNPDEPDSFWHLVRGFLLASIRRFDIAYFHPNFSPHTAPGNYVRRRSDAEAATNIVQFQLPAAAVVPQDVRPASPTSAAADTNLPVAPSLPTTAAVTVGQAIGSRPRTPPSQGVHRSLASELAAIASSNPSSPTSSSISEVSLDSAIARSKLVSSHSRTALRAANTAVDPVSLIALHAASSNESSISRKAPRAASTDVANITRQLRQLSRRSKTVAGPIDSDSPPTTPVDSPSKSISLPASPIYHPDASSRAPPPPADRTVA